MAGYAASNDFILEKMTAFKVVSKYYSILLPLVCLNYLSYFCTVASLHVTRSSLGILFHLSKKVQIFQVYLSVGFFACWLLKHCFSKTNSLTYFSNNFHRLITSILQSFNFTWFSSCFHVIFASCPFRVTFFHFTHKRLKTVHFIDSYTNSTLKLILLQD